MELKEFIENFKEVFDDEDLMGINGDTFFKELDVWSSLSALSLIAMVDENYNVAITGNDIRKADTIEDLYNIVKSRANV